MSRRAPGPRRGAAAAAPAGRCCPRWPTRPRCWAGPAAGPRRRRGPALPAARGGLAAPTARGELPAWNPGDLPGHAAAGRLPPGRALPADGRAGPAAALRRPSRSLVLALAGRGRRRCSYAYLRRLGAEPRGRVRGRACRFALGPYLVAHLGDTATLVAAPLLPAAAARRRRRCMRRAARARGRPGGGAGAPAAGRLAGGRARRRRAAGRPRAGRPRCAGPRPAASLPRWRWSALGAGVLLAAPQLLPTLLAARDAGPAADRARRLGRGACCPALTGLVLRYVSHTPAPVAGPGRAAAARSPGARARAGRGPRSSRWRCSGDAARSPRRARLPLVFDLTLCVLAGLSPLRAVAARREPRDGACARYFLVACLASAAALVGGRRRAGPAAARRSRARWACWRSRSSSTSPTPTSPDPRAGGRLAAAADRLLPAAAARPRAPGTARPPRRDLRRRHRHARRRSTAPWARAATSRMLTLVARVAAAARPPDLGLRATWPGSPARRSVERLRPHGRRCARRAALGGMSAGGMLPGAFFRSDPGAARAAGRALGAGARASRWRQPGARAGRGAATCRSSRGGRASSPSPSRPPPRCASSRRWSDAVGVAQGEVVARGARAPGLRPRASRSRCARASRPRSGPTTGPTCGRACAHRARRPIAELAGRRAAASPGHRYLAVLRAARPLLRGRRAPRAPRRAPGRLHAGAPGRRRRGHRRTRARLVARGAYVSDAGRFREARPRPPCACSRCRRSAGRRGWWRGARAARRRGGAAQALAQPARLGRRPAARGAGLTAADARGRGRCRADAPGAAGPRSCAPSAGRLERARGGAGPAGGGRRLGPGLDAPRVDGAPAPAAAREPRADGRAARRRASTACVLRYRAPRAVAGRPRPRALGALACSAALRARARRAASRG